jgi:hypothetical protein
MIIEGRDTSRWNRSGLVLTICLSWLSLSIHPFWRYLDHAKALGAMFLGVIAIALGLGFLSRLIARNQQIGLVWFALLAVLLTTLFVILYPISLKHTLNTGSDREDALRIALTAIWHHQYPYQYRTYLNMTITPLPGALLLAAPFFALGHVAWQNFLWVGLFFVFVLSYFKSRSTALIFLTLFLLLTPAVLSDITSGADYIVNFCYVAIAVFLVVRSSDRSVWSTVAAAAFLGVALSSRIMYTIILIPLTALLVQRATPRQRLGLIFGVMVFAALAVTLPVFAPHPVAHLMQQLGQQSYKMRYLPPSIHAPATLPILGALICCSAFFVRMDTPRLFLIFGLANLSMLGPSVLSIAIHNHKPMYDLSYLAACMLPLSLWTFARYEESTCKSLDMPESALAV